MRTGNDTLAIKNILKQRIQHYEDAQAKLGELSKETSLTGEESKMMESVIQKIDSDIAPLKQMLDRLSSVSTKCAYCGETVSFDGEKYSCPHCQKVYVLAPYVPKVEKSDKRKQE